LRANRSPVYWLDFPLSKFFQRSPPLPVFVFLSVFTRSSQVFFCSPAPGPCLVKLNQALIFFCPPSPPFFPSPTPPFPSRRAFDNPRIWVPLPFFFCFSWYVPHRNTFFFFRVPPLCNYPGITILAHIAPPLTPLTKNFPFGNYPVGRFFEPQP